MRDTVITFWIAFVVGTIGAGVILSVILMTEKRLKFVAAVTQTSMGNPTVSGVQAMSTLFVRNFLKYLFGSSFLLTDPTKQVGGTDMKVMDVKVFPVGPWIFVKVETDEDIHGWGEAFSGPRGDSVQAALGELGHYFVGKDPFLVEHHFQVLYHRYAWTSRGPTVLGAISGVEHALWDIIGKALGQPVYNLLGGRCRDEIRMYATAVNRATPELCVEQARDLVKQGYTALKVDVVSGPEPPLGLGSDRHRNFMQREYMQLGVDIFAKTRDAVGDRVDLMAHAHAELNPRVALQLLRKIEPYDPFWFEEPVQPENIDAMAWVASHTNVPIATGERLFTRYDFKDLLDAQAVSIVQPDAAVAGGLWETRKIAALAEPYYVSFAPHCPGGPVITAVSMQIAACTPNFLILEHGVGRDDIVKDIVKDPLRLEKGAYRLSSKPGLGLELDEDAFSQHPYQPRTIPAHLGYDDGTIFGKR
jgi:galactonate dehydratase